ncbi:electron transport complex subunit RsxC [Aliidiomarina sanyensis]|uniref:Ion-translocating oxidoreductase complex subunit C n=1 Tax=Aliidiomarina sanyensis TaxID=1249555 RepID=A0A432WNN3_9GAMM|nr:electron transport complex subunit RsxC [Aliidiomarina sanyensis]RUO35319.1 electron transport complex subunit RsxC [Aliidiomarina sanyensis]
MSSSASVNSNTVQLWSFPGGIHPPERKAPANETPIRRFPIAPELIVPLRQHIGALGELVVQVGDYVRKGQALTQPGIEHGLPVHAPTSGIIVEIGDFPLNHPSAMRGPGIRLRADGDDLWIDRHPLPNYQSSTRLQVLEHLHQYGIAGLGGAGFPTARKIASANGIDVLIINGVECEPYIAADDRLMREHADAIVRGTEALQWLTQAKRVVIAIEDNKPEAITAMQSAAQNATSSVIEVVVIPTKYPSGGERQLIQILTGKQVPAQGLPLDIGVLMHNTGTAFAVSRALEKGEPLIERVVTLTGEALATPCTAWVPLGTPVAYLLEQAGFTPERDQRVIMGGPMMGFTLPHLQVPVIKTTNCILAPTRTELPAAGPEMPCIRCGACADVCPASLLPQQLYWFAKSKDYDGLKTHHLPDCIECGACAYVCPSEIPLVQYYRQAKAEMREQAIEHQKAEIARQRFEARQARLEREKQERLERHRKAAEAREAALAAREQNTPAASEGDNDPVKAALARVKAKKAAAEGATTSSASSKDDQVAAAVARAKARKAAREAENQTSNTPAKPSAQNDAPRVEKPVSNKDQVAAAVARAKARKAARDAEKDKDS